METLKTLWNKYREIILYLIFGAMTTVVGLGSYFVILKVAGVAFGVEEGQPAYNGVRAVAQILQWVFAVLFAYFTNKRWVFRAEGGNETRRLASFFGARLFTLGADSVVTFGIVFLLGIFGYETFSLDLIITIRFTPDLWGKGAAAVVVIILNYVLSKFIVFRKEKAKSK